MRLRQRFSPQGPDRRGGRQLLRWRHKQRQRLFYGRQPRRRDHVGGVVDGMHGLALAEATINRLVLLAVMSACGPHAPVQVVQPPGRQQMPGPEKTQTQEKPGVRRSRGR
jgi:hypothetical protein